MKKAIFLDRDGTLNIDIGYAYKIDDCKLIENNIGSILKKFKDSGYLLIVITNQAGIDKGFYTRKDFDLFMKELEKQLNIKFDGIYFCPYHPDFTGKRKCRKPNNGMFIQAGKDLKIDYTKSYMIGDNIKDIEAGKKTGCKTILYNSGGIKDIYEKPDFVTKKWSDIEKFILKNN